MPAKKKRGKGFRFTRKKQHKINPSSNSTPSGSGAALVAVKRTARKPPKTPQVQLRVADTQGVDSATSSRRKGKEISSAPRRVSPRLLAKKMSLENGSLVPVSTNNTMDHGTVTQPPADDHIDDNNNNADNNNREGDAVEENEGEENENHRGSNNTQNKTNNKSKGTGAVIRGKQQGKKQQLELEPELEEVEDSSDDDDVVFDDEQEDLERQLFERGTGPVKQLAVAKISVTTDVNEVEEDYINHAVLMYFCKTGGVTMTRSHVKEWIYNNLGDKETIGPIRYCRDLSRGFFFVYFERTVSRRKALASKPQESGLQVIVFPWSPATVNSDGEHCTPRMIALPGLPDQYFPILPNIGNALGTYIGSIGALDPEADLKAVRNQNGWESACNSTVTSESAPPRIAVMMPPEVRLPNHVELEVRAGVSLKQPIYEQLPHQQGVKRGAPGKRVAGQNGSARKKSKA